MYWLLNQVLICWRHQTYRLVCLYSLYHSFKKYSSLGHVYGSIVWSSSNISPTHSGLIVNAWTSQWLYYFSLSLISLAFQCNLRLISLLLSGCDLNCCSLIWHHMTLLAHLHQFDLQWLNTCTIYLSHTKMFILPCLGRSVHFHSFSIMYPVPPCYSQHPSQYCGGHWAE